ncbi:MAG: glutaredoxin domain-containing protein [Parcubacteria group bacterium]
MQKKIEIYSTANCHFCHMAKEYFALNNLTFTDYNVGVDTEKRSEMVEISGQMGVPVIVVDGKEVVVGFDKKYLAGLLGTPA